MRKLLCSFIALCMTAQFGFSVMASESVIYELKTENMSVGDMREDVINTSEQGTVKVMRDEETGDKYIAVSDLDTSVGTGYYKGELEFKDVVTISFDYRIPKDARRGAKFYISSNGNPVSIELNPQIVYFENTTLMPTAGKIVPGGKWANITCVIDVPAASYDLYKNGMQVIDNAPFRAGSKIGGYVALRLFGDNSAKTVFDFKNLVIHQGEVIPEMTEEIPPEPDRTLVDFANASERLDAKLGNAVAMSIGNSMARVNNGYVHIDPDNVYVAPYITADGYTLIPARFTAEAIGASVEVVSATCFRFSKNGTVIEFNMGDKNAIVNGAPVEMPTVPVIRMDRLHVPVRFAAEYFGKKVFWDDRGLIIISDGNVINAGEEDIIKPLISEIRNYTTIFGNKKYSDVNYSSRFYRLDGHDGGQWSSPDAAKRFMATVNRWTYVISGSDNKILSDLGLLNQGTLNGNFEGGTYPVSTYFFNGAPYTRADGVKGTTWGCVSDPAYYEHILGRAKAGIDSGIFAWQYDDWPLNANFRNGGCFCDYCVSGFAEFLSKEVTPEVLAEAGVENPASFNYKEYLVQKGITEPGLYPKGTPIDALWNKYNEARAVELNTRLIKDMEEYAGEEIYFSINAPDTASSITYSWAYNIPVDGVMGETHAPYTTAESIFTNMLFTRAMGIENVISPLPSTPSAKELMYSAIPMCYATGQFMLIPWDNWLFGSTRYYATLEELAHTYELPREYPYLFDNYEIPELIGYVYDFDKLENPEAAATEILKSGMPARAVARRGTLKNCTFEANDFKGLQALVAGTELSDITDVERAAIENSGVMLIAPDDTASLNYIKSAYWMTKSGNSDVYTVLRQNQLYDNAPVVVHAVNYNSEVQKNVEVEINNLYLPQGDRFTVNVYKPGENREAMTVTRGEGSTKITIDSVDRWTVLEICGPSTVRREAAFDLGTGINGIGLGTRISKDKVYGTANDFTIVTYGEGINSTTFNDAGGSQDEAAFIYKRLGKGILKDAWVSAQFTEANGAYGVMVREGIYSNAKFAALIYDPEKGLRIAVRKDTNVPASYIDISSDKPAYMKLQRAGREYVAYTSQDGSKYKEVGRVELVLDETTAGVFASSANGSRSECRVQNLNINPGKAPSGEFTSFEIKYKNGKISETATDAKLEFKLSTETYTDIPVDEVDVKFASDNESVLKVDRSGTLIPIKPGKATISATATMGLRRISESTVIEVVAENPVVYAESFDGKELPAGISASQGVVEVKDGALRLSSTAEGGSVITKNISFKQPKNKNLYFEFDFRAHFGTTQPTTGAGVLYGNNAGFAMTCDVNEFNWFFRDDQRFVTPMEGDKWYRIKIYINYEEQYANVWVDDKLIVDHGEMKESVCEPDGIFWVRAWRLGKDTYYEWDNFNFYFEK